MCVEGPVAPHPRSRAESPEKLQSISGDGQQRLASMWLAGSYLVCADVLKEDVVRVFRLL